MPYTVLPDGSIQTGDADDAIRLSKLLRKQAGGSTDANGASPTPPAQDSVGARNRKANGKGNGGTELSSALSEAQRTALAAIQKGPIKLAELAAVLGFSKNNGVGGVMAGISKNAAKTGVAVDDLFSKRWDGSTWIYEPTATLKEADLSLK